MYYRLSYRALSAGSILPAQPPIRLQPENTIMNKYLLAWRQHCSSTSLQRGSYSFASSLAPAMGFVLTTVLTKVPTKVSTAVSTAALTAILTTGPVLAETYRIVDENGNVTYTDQPNHAGNGGNKATIEKLPEAEEHNVVPSLKTLAESEPQWLRQAREQREASEEQERELQQAVKKSEKALWKERYKAAKAQLKEAELALEVGSEPGEGDFIGKVGGGARPSSDYIMRLEALEKAVADARRDLAKVKRSRP